MPLAGSSKRDTRLKPEERPACISSCQTTLKVHARTAGAGKACGACTSVADICHPEVLAHFSGIKFGSQTSQIGNSTTTFFLASRFTARLIYPVMLLRLTGDTFLQHLWLNSGPLRFKPLLPSRSISKEIKLNK